MNTRAETDDERGQRTVLRQMEIEGVGTGELLRRLDQVRADLRARRGVLLNILWHAEDAGHATVVYTLPLEEEIHPAHGAPPDRGPFRARRGGLPG
jgi:hypothetical protein